MKNKRGVGSGIDWVLGVGIFIMSITFIFILFKPGVTPVHDQETLLNIVQDGFENSVSWEITEVPIFISRLYGDFSGEQVIFLSTDDGFDLDPEDDTNDINIYGDQLENILSDAAYPNMKLFYVLRDVDEGSNSITNPSHLRENLPRGEEGADEGEVIYAEEATAVCQEAARRDEDDESSRGRDTAVLEELCEEERGRDRGRFRSSDVGDARTLYIGYEGRVGENTPYSRIERENELIFFINPISIPEGDDEIVSPDNFIMPAYLDEGKTKYILVVASEPINFALNRDITSGSIPGKACYAYGPQFDSVSSPEGVDYNLLEDDDCRVVYELGAKKTIGGVHLPSLLALENFEGNNCDLGYECIKKEWDFPELREFMIKIETIPEGSGGEECDPEHQLCYKFPANKPGPPANINRFVRQFNSFLLTDDGVKIPIIVRLTVW